MKGTRIIPLDLFDTDREALAQEWLDVHLDANETVWGPGVNERTTLAQMRVAHRAPTLTRVPLAAVDDAGGVVGSADVILPVRESTDTAGVWLSVRPDRWRHGIGTQLLAHVEKLVMEHGRTRMLEHSGTPVAIGDPASAFAVANGYELVLTDLCQEVASPRLPGPSASWLPRWATRHTRSSPSGTSCPRTGSRDERTWPVGCRPTPLLASTSRRRTGTPPGCASAGNGAGRWGGAASSRWPPPGLR